MTNQNLTETSIDNNDLKTPLEHQIQQQEMKTSGWRFDNINSLAIYFYKTGELNGSKYNKIPFRSNAILNIGKIDKYCFIWSILASLCPCNKNHPNRVSICRQYFSEISINSFDFTNRFKRSDVHIFNEINNLSINIFELNFYQDQKKMKHKLIPIEVSRNDSDRVIDLAVYRNHYVLIKILNEFLGDHTKNFICRQCLSS